LWAPCIGLPRFALQRPKLLLPSAFLLCPLSNCKRTFVALLVLLTIRRSTCTSFPWYRSVYIEDHHPNPVLPMLHALARLVFPIAFSFLLIKFAFRCEAAVAYKPRGRSCCTK
jgi:hypothetical protein